MILSTTRAWKRIGYGFLILIALVMIAYGGLSLWANRSLAPKLAALHAAGEPTSIAELAPEPVLAEEDGATNLAEIAPEIEAFSKDYGQFYQTPLGKSYEQRTEKGERPSAEEIDAIRSILERYANIELALRNAIECPSYASQLDFSLEFNPFLEALIDKAQDLRSCSRMLGWKSEILRAEGNIEDAVQAGVLALQLSRLQAKEPGIVNGLVANAIRYNAVDIINRALRSGPLESDFRKSLDAQLTKFDDLDWFQQNLKSERAINLSGAEDLFPHYPVAWQGNLFKADTIDFYQELLPLAQEPYYLSREKLAKVEQLPGSAPISGVLISILFPSLESAYVSANQSLALIRSLRILNSLQAYKAAHGKEATTLVDLDLPESATIDPFDGKPLKLKWTQEGWIIYSVYKNGVDDGGSFTEQQDAGIGPTGLLP